MVEGPLTRMKIAARVLIGVTIFILSFLFSFLMGDGDETAKLWKVNRTIHELVKDRVSSRKPSPNSTVRDLTAVYFVQGFMVADEEINMDLQRFRDLYANQSGVVE